MLNTARIWSIRILNRYSMFLGDLPLEIQDNILEHCSPSDLAVLSRVHTSVRDVAEYTLYAHIATARIRST